MPAREHLAFTGGRYDENLLICLRERIVLLSAMLDHVLRADGVRPPVQRIAHFQLEIGDHADIHVAVVAELATRLGAHCGTGAGASDFPQQVDAFAIQAARGLAGGPPRARQVIGHRTARRVAEVGQMRHNGEHVDIRRQWNTGGIADHLDRLEIVAALAAILHGIAPVRGFLHAKLELLVACVVARDHAIGHAGDQARLPQIVKPLFRQRQVDRGMAMRQAAVDVVVGPRDHLGRTAEQFGKIRVDGNVARLQPPIGRLGVHAQSFGGHPFGNQAGGMGVDQAEHQCGVFFLRHGLDAIEYGCGDARLPVGGVCVTSLMRLLHVDLSISSRLNGFAPTQPVCSAQNLILLQEPNIQHVV
ncbi:Uncharacterised protein [Bordetella pertussis]|nr:Uncharacterised protein [Bordetella pertussis]